MSWASISRGKCCVAADGWLALPGRQSGSAWLCLFYVCFRAASGIWRVLACVCWHLRYGGVGSRARSALQQTARIASELAPGEQLSRFCRYSVVQAPRCRTASWLQGSFSDLISIYKTTSYFLFDETSFASQCKDHAQFLTRNRRQTRRCVLIVAAANQTSIVWHGLAGARGQSQPSTSTEFLIDPGVREKRGAGAACRAPSMSR